MLDNMDINNKKHSNKKIIVRTLIILISIVTVIAIIFSFVQNAISFFNNSSSIYYIFADISECEKLLSYENTNNQKVIKQLTPNNDEKLKKLPYNQYFAIEYKSDTLYYQIYAYEFYNSDDALNYFVNVTGQTSFYSHANKQYHDVYFLEYKGLSFYNIVVSVENKAYRITTRKKHENEIKRMLGNVFSLEYIN